MRSFDASATAVDVLPIEVLAQLDDLVGDYLLVGARARDLITHCVAGLPLGRATHDVDISIAVVSMTELWDLLGSLQTRRKGLARFRVGDTPVDVLPYGPVATDGMVEPEDGVLLDVTGMAEARSTAIRISVASGQSVHCASLAAMILLKLVAWDMRQGYTDKDALDLALLLDASHSGAYEEPCWDDDVAARYDYDVFLVGPYVQGLAIARDFSVASRSRILPLLEDGDRSEQLTRRMPPGVAPRADQLAAVAAGMRAV